MSQIEFDFYAVRSQVEQAEELKNTLRELVSGEYTEAMQSLGMAWDGANAQQFQAKMERLKEQLEHTAVLLGQAQTRMEEACKKVEAVEREAEEIAGERSYP